MNPIDGPGAQELAEQELRKAEYHRDDPGLSERIVDWLVGRIEWILSGTPGGSATLVLLVILAAVVIFAVVKAGPVGRRFGRATGPDADPLRPVGARDHRRLAERAEASGDWAEALREWLRAAIQVIEDRGVLDARPGRTGAAVAREAGAVLPTAADALRAATHAFDEVWFGGRPATQQDAGLGRAAADTVRHARPVTASTPSGYAVPS